MRILAAFTAMLTAGVVPAFAQGGSAGPYAVPSAAAYAIIANAAHKIVADNTLQGGAVVIYDAGLFGLVPTYGAAVEHLKKTMATMCTAPAANVEMMGIAPIDVGGAASGLAALITALTPSYAILGQAFPFDNSTLVAAFAKEVGAKVVYPAYLMPASKMNDLNCGGQDGSSSLVDLWYAAAKQAAKLRDDIANISGATEADKAKKKALQDKVDAYAKIAETYLAIDKGTSLLAKLLVVEGLTKVIPETGIAVIDLKLDAVGMESITRTWVGVKKTNFACSVLAHYALLNLTKSKSTLALTLTKTDTLNILTKIPNEDKFGSSVTPLGEINGANSNKEP